MRLSLTARRIERLRRVEQDQVSADPPAAFEREPAQARRPPSPFEGVGSASGRLVRFLWEEKRSVALTAVFYVGGLGVWWLNAGLRDLDFGAAADLQHLVAGLVPALLLAVGAALIVALLRVPAWVNDRFRSWRPELAKRIAWLGGVLVFASMLGFAILGPAGVLDRYPALSTVVLAFGIAGIVLLAGAGEGTAFFRFILIVYGAVGVVTLLATAVLFYALAVYPVLPQSLGGGRPRCAELDLDAGSVSRETLAELAPGASSGEIVRTPRLDVVFTRGDTLFVRRSDDDRVLELRGAAIRAVADCD